MEEILHQLIDGLSMFIPLFIGFQPSFWWCRISPNSIRVVGWFWSLNPILAALRSTSNALITSRGISIRAERTRPHSAQAPSKEAPASCALRVTTSSSLGSSAVAAACRKTSNCSKALQPWRKVGEVGGCHMNHENPWDDMTVI